jgi:hypothetical protein
VKKKPKPIIDSRHLKILAAKKEELKDSVVFICLDDEKYGHYDVAQLRKLAESIEKIEPSAFYFVGLKTLRVNIFDRAEFKNRDIVVTVSHSQDMGEAEIEEGFNRAFNDAKSISFVHHYAEKVTWGDNI